MPQFKEADRRAISEYTAQLSQSISSYLRGRMREWPGVAEKIAAVDRAVARGSLPTGATCYRGIDDVGETVMRRRWHLEQGATISDPAFLSTTRNLEVALSFAGHLSTDPAGGLIMLVKARPGTVALDVSGYSNFPEEEEIIFPRDTPMIVTGFDPVLRVLSVEA